MKPSSRQLGVYLFRIIFDDPGLPSRLHNLDIADVAFYGPSESVAGELKFAPGQLALDLFYPLHRAVLDLAYFWV